MNKILEGLRKDVQERINEYNELLLACGKFDDMVRVEEEIRDAEAKYADQQMHEIFSWCGKQPNPILAAVKRYDYPILSHRLNREDGIVTEMVLVETRTKQIDLVKLCKVLNLDHLWEYKVEKFGNLLCMRAAKDLGWTDTQVKEIERLYYCNALSRSVEMGAVPTSNTQICKLLQQVIDAVLPMDPETGKAKYRCNSHDVAYLLMCYTKRSNKAKLSIDVAKNSFVHRLVMDVMHRIVTGAQYDLKYAQIKQDAVKKAEGSKAEVSTSEEVSIPRPARKSAPKAEAPAAEVLTSEEESESEEC